MVYLLTFLFALPSGIFWFFNAELLVVTQVETTDAAPWLIAACTTGGQFIGYAALYLFADRFLARLGVVQRSVTRVQRRFPRILPPDPPVAPDPTGDDGAGRPLRTARPVGWGSYAFFFTGGLMGLPPLLALFALYGSARLGRLELLLAFAMPARLVWYLLWAYAPDFIRDLSFFS